MTILSTGNINKLIAWAKNNKALVAAVLASLAAAGVTLPEWIKPILLLIGVQ